VEGMSTTLHTQGVVIQASQGKASKPADLTCAADSLSPFDVAEQVQLERGQALLVWHWLVLPSQKWGCL